MPTFLNEAPIRPTHLASAADTVSLDARPMRTIAWLGVAGLALFALRDYFRRTDGEQSDAIDELAQEARAIQRRNAARRGMTTAL